MRRFALPEGDAGWCAVGVFDEHLAPWIDALNAPAGVAEQDHVAGMGVDGEVLVEGGDLHVFRLQHHGEQGRIRDCAAIGDGRHARAAAWVQHARHAIAQEVCAVAAAAVFNAGVQQRDQLVELRTL